MASPLLVVPVRHDGLPGAVHAVGPEGLLCGRSQGQLRFGQDATVSPAHVRFTPEADGAVVEDLGSLNGTFLRLRAARPIAPGDELRLGRQRLRVEAVPAGPAPGPVRPWGSRDTGQRARLVQLLEGGGTGDVFALRDGANAIGRAAGAIRFADDRYASARHARIDVAPEGMTLTDVGSSNGTYVRIAGPVRITAGDQLLVGMQLLRVDR